MAPTAHRVWAVEYNKTHGLAGGELCHHNGPHDSHECVRLRRRRLCKQACEAANIAAWSCELPQSYVMEVEDA